MARADVKGASVTVIFGGADDYISLTDSVLLKNSDHADDLIRHRPRNQNTLEFLGIWEQPSNLSFHPVEFGGMRMQAGLNTFKPVNLSEMFIMVAEPHAFFKVKRKETK